MKDKIGLGKVVGLIEVVVPFLVVEIFRGIGDMKECTDGKQSHKYINKDQRICQDVVE